METYFDTLAKGIYEEAYKIITVFLKENKDNNSKIHIPNDFKEEFFSLVDKVTLSLMEDKDNFYGYFLFQMSREIRFDISSPTAVNFKGSKYVIYFNPIIFLTLTIKQMESTIKHEILHIISMHLIRAKEYKTKYGTLAVNMAMDVVVNTYLDHLPPYATTLEWVNLNLSLKLLPFESFEYYAEEIQTAIDLLEEDEDAVEDDSNNDEIIELDYDPEKTHDIWEDISDLDEKTLKEFTEKSINHSQKGTVPAYLESMITSLKNSKSELPWNLYLKRLMGTVESSKKKTITRRNRRQPDRLDLRGQLNSHKAKIAVALDISGSISDEEFNQAIKEVLSIVKNVNHEITIIECDSDIRRVYTIKSVKDIKDRMNVRGSTKFNPVFEYANNKKINLLVYFTDGKGEDKLLSIPQGYKTLWILSGRGDTLSLKEAYGTVKKLNTIEIKDNTFDMRDVPREGYSMNNQQRMHV
ncbi:vWA domain-containing protein [Pelosinus propionicus]|uniref:Predicted metal-dependent peptidase n=1 Tax=Pelosinus propionicus DSM 13327 TaxID=1123291 RepID=A0A1I4M8Y4_9FIRM|nr:VWA-like domain-containing protein [Pelosinus propionicus]SFL99698.1 Predicted metal-dependent peptidase [Pelosinus propionicus DSM 13327]